MAGFIRNICYYFGWIYQKHRLSWLELLETMMVLAGIKRNIVMAGMIINNYHQETMTIMAGIKRNTDYLDWFGQKSSWNYKRGLNKS